MTPPSQMLKAVLRREHTSFSLSLKAYVPLALLYGYTLALSWRPDLLGTLLPGSLAAGFQGRRRRFSVCKRGYRMRGSVDFWMVAHDTWMQHPHAGGWNPQFFPRLEGIMAIFSRPDTALSVWLHVLATSLFSAQNLCRQGENGAHGFLQGYDQGILCGTMRSCAECCAAGTQENSSPCSLHAAVLVQPPAPGVNPPS